MYYTSLTDSELRFGEVIITDASPEAIISFMGKTERRDIDNLRMTINTQHKWPNILIPNTEILYEFCMNLRKEFGLISNTEKLEMIIYIHDFSNLITENTFASVVEHLDKILKDTYITIIVRQ